MRAARNVEFLRKEGRNLVLTFDSGWISSKVAKQRRLETFVKEYDVLHTRLLDLKEAELRADADLRRHRATLRVETDRERRLLRNINLVAVAALVVGAFAFAATVWGFLRWMALQRMQDALLRAQIKALSPSGTSGSV